MGSGENLSFSDVDGSEDAVLQLLIDDGVSDRGHRKNILNNKFTHGGVSCGCHTEYVEMWCFAYGIDVKEKDASLVADSAPQLKECKAYNSRTEGTTNQNYHLDKAPSKPAKADTTSPAKPAKADNNSSKKQTDNQVKPKENNSRKQVNNQNIFLKCVTKDILFRILTKIEEILMMTYFQDCLTKILTHKDIIHMDSTVSLR